MDSLPSVLLTYRRVPLRLMNWSSALVVSCCWLARFSYSIAKVARREPILSQLTFGLPSRFWFTKDQCELYDRSDGPRLPVSSLRATHCGAIYVQFLT